MKMKLAIAMALVAPLAFAQSYSTDTKTVTAQGIQRVGYAVINSGTQLVPYPVLPLENVSVFCTGSTSVSVSLVYVTNNGNTLLASSAALCGTTPTRLAQISASSVDFQGIVVSPTAGLTAANTVTVNIVRSPAVPKQY